MSEATTDQPTASTGSGVLAAWLQRVEWDRVTAAVAAAALLFIAMGLPLWRMTLLAPQYPGGLHMSAYGDRFEGDVREINILNHYIGMKPINGDEVLEFKIFRPAMFALIGTLLVLAFAPLAHWLKVAQALLIWLLPLGIIADLQWWLYRYGHSMDPMAPLRLTPFTPHIVGTTKVMNFHNEAEFAVAFWLIVAAAAVISLAPSLLRAFWELPRAYMPAAQPRIADLIAAATPGETVIVPPGVYREHLVIDKPIVLDGRNRAVIDGGGVGDVVVVKANDVGIRRFTIRNSGDAVSQEPAGVRLLGHNTVLSNNRIENVYFGVTVQGGGHHQIEFNTIRPAPESAVEWRGHGISVWNSEGNVIRRNEISGAKDGFYISFSHHNFIHGNRVRQSRFGIHYMYADDNRFTENVFTENLSGALVMYSKRLFLRGNEFSKNHGGTGFGLLLKNVDDLWAEDNRVTANGTGISLDEAPSSPTAAVTFHRNLIALNQTGLALLTTTAVTFYENSLVDNARQVSGRGSSLMFAGHQSQLAPAAPANGVDHTAHGGAPVAQQAAPNVAAAGAAAGNRWSADGRGNYWSDYTGYDGDGDGLGDRPYRSVSAFAALRDRNAVLDLFSYTPAQQAIDAAARLFPLVRPEVLIEDPAPLIAPPTPLPRAGDGRGLLVSAAALLLAGALPAAIVLRLGWRGRRPVRRPALERIPS